jgi:spore germination cell wall hydrolase CwlJ-like protein
MEVNIMNKLKKFSVIAACVLLLYPTSTAYAAKYTVVKNDSLFIISQLFKTPVKTLKSDNRLKSDEIYPGQKLQVAAKKYTVKSGDTMYLIAKKYGISLASLMKANNKYNAYIVPGKKLTIPGVKPTASSTNTSTTASKTTNSNTAPKTTSTTTEKSAVIPYTNSEVDLLARLIEAEASGEAYNVKVAVGAVVVNRIQSKEWASTITGVIYQKYGSYYQFTPVQNGMINKPASEDSIKAAREAIYGKDPSNGAIYYYDNTTTNTWIRSKTITARLGNMTFAK